MARRLRLFISTLIPSQDEHLPDDRLTSFGDGLSFVERLSTRRHLAQCSLCRARRQELNVQRADEIIELCSEAVEGEELSLDAKPREEFRRRLHSQMVQMQNTAPCGRWSFRFPHISLPQFPPMSPALATCLVLSFATAISFFYWWQQRVPNISSNTLLVRAERWDASNLGRSSGVVFQTVRIRTQRQTVERAIYRDVEGKRQPRRVKLVEQEEQLRSALFEAGVDWDEPISASGYQRWHDRQYVHEDRITRAGNHLLMLTTTVPDGSISEQSLTVRDTDFHPVQRTVAFRDSHTIEVAELDFKILPWNAIDTNAFEPIGSVLSSIPTNTARVLQFPRIPEIVTEDQLDETELEARLVLSTLGADTGEQIEIGRIPQGVEVRGLVDTDERKRALQTHLQTVPHLRVSIRSIADVQSNPGVNDAVSEIKAASMPDQPSPLEKYLLPRGRSVIDINVLAHRLFENARTISQESKAIADLQTRFASAERHSVVAAAALSELIYSHHERLVAALNQEHKLLTQVQGAPEIHHAASTPQPGLTDAAFKLLTLSQELTQSNSPDTRKADAILAEMSDCMKDLTSGLQQAYAQPHQGDSPSGGKR